MAELMEMVQNDADSHGSRLASPRAAIRVQRPYYKGQNESLRKKSKIGELCVPCVCLLLQDLLQSCSRGGEEESGRHVL
jgi:hypothetical protein